MLNVITSHSALCQASLAHFKASSLQCHFNSLNANVDQELAPLVTDEAAAELEMIDLCEEDQLKSVLRKVTVEFWKSGPMEKYPNVKRDALAGAAVHDSIALSYSLLSLRLGKPLPKPIAPSRDTAGNNRQTRQPKQHTVE